MAQSNVYSLNVVGYVNTVFKGGFNLVANPLNAPTNTLGALMSGANVPDNTQVYIWDTVAQDFAGSTPTYVASSKTWVPDQTIAPGQGIFVFAPSGFTNTFVGEVLQGSMTNSVSPSFNAIASPVPIAGAVGLVLTNFPAIDNDQAFQWDTTAQDFVNSSTYVATSKTWVPSINFGVGEGVFYMFNGSAKTNWVRAFTVQ